MARSFPQGGVEIEARQRRERHNKTWERFAAARALVRDWVVPMRWASPVELADCRQDYDLDRSLTRADMHALRTQFSCQQVPWCIPDTQIRVWKRVRDAENRIQRWTPPQEQPRTIHAVFMAPLFVDGRGSGAKAMRNLTQFFACVHDTLATMFGEGIGWEGSYQDFGEVPFTKSAPHVDLTLNGWVVQSGKVVPLAYDPQRDKPKLNRAFDAAMSKFGFDENPDEYDSRGVPTGNCWMGPPRRGVRAARGAFAYQMRELVDLRKVRYDGKRVGWQSYRDDSVDWMRADKFPQWYQSYEERVRPHEPNRVHRKFGYMAGRFSKQAQAQGFSGDVPPHETGCACRDCDDWERVVDAASLYPALERALGRPAI